MSEAQVLIIAGTIILLLIALVGWFAQMNYNRVVKDLEAEEAARLADVHKVRNEVAAAIARLEAFRLEVAKECINSDRLTTALAPINERLTEIKADQRRLFERMDGKQDKPGGRE